jgi:hypothetical protein
MTPLARDLGDEGEPFRWDEDRRARLRAELDAFFFRLYGIDVLAEYDRMGAAEASGVPYESTLPDKPGSGPRHPPANQPRSTPIDSATRL